MKEIFKRVFKNKMAVSAVIAAALAIYGVRQEVSDAILNTVAMVF